ncbi:hypothetical protein J6TS7_04170 [Paenibacillus dendritiformis]|nr:hypothetical protein J6TS7_04170 [Paenibacillus dendritiformis]
MTNCNCLGKEEEWHFDDDLGCWYVCRECEECGYYWEGPYYHLDDPELRPE